MVVRVFIHFSFFVFSHARLLGCKCCGDVTVVLADEKKQKATKDKLACPTRVPLTVHFHLFVARMTDFFLLNCSTLCSTVFTIGI